MPFPAASGSGSDWRGRVYGRPRLIVLDEPNANLDTDGERALIRAIEALRADGAIIVLIAHRPSIMQAADKIMVLQEGRISQFGPRALGRSADHSRREADCRREIGGPHDESVGHRRNGRHQCPRHTWP